MAKSTGTTRSVGSGSASASRTTSRVSNSAVISNFERRYNEIKDSAFSRRDIQSLGTKELNKEYQDLVDVHRQLASIDPSSTIDDSTFTRQEDHRLGDLRREYYQFTRKIEVAINRYEEELDKRYKV